MEVINFDQKSDLTKETTVTIYWYDEDDPVQIQVTAFGNAEGSRRMLVFYNDNLSEAPILIANEEAIKYVELTPLETPEESGDSIEAEIGQPH